MPPLDPNRMSPEERRAYDAWRFLLSERWGRLIVRQILADCLFGRCPAVPGDHDRTMMNCGLQSYAEVVIDHINTIFPEAYHLMMKEAKENDDIDRINAANADKSGDRTDGQSDPESSDAIT